MCVSISARTKEADKNVQLETFIEHRRPIVTLRLGRLLAFLIAQVRADDVDIDKRPKHSVRYPLDVVHSNHCNVNIATSLTTSDSTTSIRRKLKNQQQKSVRFCHSDAVL